MRRGWAGMAGSTSGTTLWHNPAAPAGPSLILQIQAAWEGKEAGGFRIRDGGGRDRRPAGSWFRPMLQIREANGSEVYMCTFFSFTCGTF